MNKKLAITAVIATALASALFAVVQPPRTINCTGTAAAPQVYDLGGVEYKSLVINGQYCHVKNFVIRGSVSHGVRVGNWAYAPGTAHHIEVSDFEIYDSTTEGLDGGSWGSCLKAETNSHDIYFHDGSITRCGGEAVGITGAENVLIERVTVTDGKMAGFYIDNSLNVTLRDVSASCGKDTLYWRNGKPSASYLLGDERYAQTNNASKLGNISITNAVSYGCGALSYWGGQVEPNGVNGLTFQGVFWDAYNRHYFASGERNANIVVAAEYKTSATITPTPATPTPTRTPTRTPVPVTLTPTVVKTTTPTGTPGRDCRPLYFGSEYLGELCK